MHSVKCGVWEIIDDLSQQSLWFSSPKTTRVFLGNRVNQLNSFRFVNTVIDSKLDRKVMWNHILTLRFENQRILNFKCEAVNKYTKPLDIPEKYVLYNIGKSSKVVGVSSSEHNTGDF